MVAVLVAVPVAQFQTLIGRIETVIISTVWALALVANFKPL